MTDHKITLTHVNIRQSIAILLAKLVITDIILAFVIVGFYFILIQGEQFAQGVSSNSFLFLTVFGISGLVKISLSIYIVLAWLNEYYEITPEAIIHKQGIIKRRSQRFDLSKIRGVSVEDTFLGEMCGYATVTLYDLRLNKYLDMYLIHNPDRYVRILRMLRPNLEMKSDRIRVPGIEKRDLGTDYEEEQP